MNISELSNKAILDELQTRLKSDKPMQEPVQEPQKFNANCVICGAATQVPFQPKEGYPIKCYKCYNATKVN